MDEKDELDKKTMLLLYLSELVLCFTSIVRARVW